jgi:hypothetical protein
VIGVDDHKGSDSADSSSPRLVLGRLFFRSDANRVEALFQALAAAGAGVWHASAHGMAGLFSTTETRREAIWSALRATDTHLFGTNPTRGMLSEPHLDAQWRGLRKARHTALTPRKGDDARGLFRFLSHTHGQAHCYFPSLRKSRILFIVDRQDWFGDTRATLRAPANGFVKAEMPTDRSVHHLPPEVWLRTRPPDECEPTLAALLGLVDSDLWALGRVLSVPGPDGRTVHDVMNADYRHGRSEEPLAGFDQSDTDAHVPSSAQKHFEEFFLQASRGGRVHVVGDSPGGRFGRIRDFLRVRSRLLLTGSRPT